jgi:hypothetical protein
VSGVKQQLQAVTSGNGFERRDVARLPPEVNANDAGRTWGDEFLDAGRINGVRSGFDVTKNWSEAKPLHRVGRRDEGKCRHDHFPAYLHCPHRQLKTVGRVA